MTPAPLLLLAAGAMAVAIGAGRLGSRAWLATTLTGLASALVPAVMVLAGGADWEWQSQFLLGGQPLLLRLDAVSAFFLVPLCVVGGAGTIYSHESWSDSRHPRSAASGRAWWCVLLASLGAVLLCADGLHFLLAWELFTLSAYFLITLERRESEVRAAGWLYLAASHAAVLALFAAFATLAARTGSWAFGPMDGRDDLAPLFWLALFGFGLKAGMFPLHVWLPSAHANAPSHVSAILSGVTIKVGIYGIVRFSGWLPVPAGAGWAVATLGVVSAVLGVAFALGQHDIKRLLAYHSVENIGIIFIGFGFALVAAEHGSAALGRLVLAGALLHVWNHALFKSLLFLGAGSVVHATGTREMSRLGGLWRAMPWTAASFALGAVAISGLPPLNGFVSEWLIYLGLFDATAARGPMAWAAVAAAILLAMTGALALACFVKACGIVFLGAARTPSAGRAHECGARMRGAMVGLAAACVAIGLVPALPWPALARAVSSWRPAWSGPEAPAPLAALGTAHVALAALAVAAIWGVRRALGRSPVTRVPTWDCAYVAPTARMQFSAASFAGILTEWFAFILRPHRHEQRPEGAFPAAASRADHVGETVLTDVVEPAGRAVMVVSQAVRRLQHGRVQSYLLYLLMGMAALAAAVLLWDGT